MKQITCGIGLLGLMCLLLSGLPATTQAQTINLENTTLEVTTLVDDLHVPWEILWGPDNHIWVTERDGRISRIDPNTGQQYILHSLFDCYEYSESGLMGMALHPNFADEPYVYIAYNYLNAGNRVKLVRFYYDGGSLINEEVLLENIIAASSGNHSGARLAFLPDETLLMSTGDYYNDAVAQNLESVNGKFLRFNADGSIPADNPISGSYVYSWGHRNAQGLVVAPNGIVYSSEHGPNNDDEFNIIEPNRNYGWPNVQGFCNTGSETAFCSNNNVYEPLIAWTPTVATCGIDFYNHPAIPEWQNSVLLCNLKSPALVQLKLSADGMSLQEEVVVNGYTWGRLRDVCVAPDGRVFIATSNRDGRAIGWQGFPQADDDKILQLRNADFEPVLPSPSFTFASPDSCNMLVFTNTSTDADSYLWDFGNGNTSTLESPMHIYWENGQYEVQLTASNIYDSVTTSLTVTIDCISDYSPNSSVNTAINIFPNPSNGIATISYPNTFIGGTLKLLNTNGEVVIQQQLSANNYQLQNRHLPSGLYYVQITNGKFTKAQKLLIK